MTIGCPECGALEDIPPLAASALARCRICHYPLERRSGRSINAALACSLTTLVLLFPANLAPLMTVHMLGAERSSVLASGIVSMWHGGWVILALLLGTFGIVLPFVRFGALALVLCAVRFGWRLKSIGVLFRWALWLDIWAMPDVYLVGCFVGYSRVTQNLTGVVGAGGYCFIASGAGVDAYACRTGSTHCLARHRSRAHLAERRAGHLLHGMRSGRAGLVRRKPLYALRMEAAVAQAGRYGTGGRAVACGACADTAGKSLSDDLIDTVWPAGAASNSRWRVAVVPGRVMAAGHSYLLHQHRHTGGENRWHGMVHPVRAGAIAQTFARENLFVPLDRRAWALVERRRVYDRRVRTVDSLR